VRAPLRGVDEFLGAAPLRVEAAVGDLLGGLVSSSPERIFSRINELVHYGHDLKQVYDTFTAFIRDSIVLKSVADPAELVVRQYGHGKDHHDLLEKLEVADLIRMLDGLIAHEIVFRQASEPRYAFELVFLKLLEQKKLIPLEELLSDLRELTIDDAGEKKN